MFKLRAAFIKEFQLVIRDKAGLAVMFVMPVILVVLMTAIQNSAFRLVNEHRIRLLVVNEDTSSLAAEFVGELEHSGMFTVILLKHGGREAQLHRQLQIHDALSGLLIPAGYFEKMSAAARYRSSAALQQLGLGTAVAGAADAVQEPLSLLFQPVLQEAYRYSINKSVQGLLMAQQNKLMINEVYALLSEGHIPAGLEQQLMGSGPLVKELTVSVTGAGRNPNASQHNVPAWTLFAMFFTVISIGSNLVKEKRSGSFMRIRVMPTNYMLALAARQLLYLFVVMMQLALIVSIGIFLFPLLGLPGLSSSMNWPLVALISLVCGLAAISYAMCIGVFARTQEQANGFGAVSVVILAALGGIFVPAFAMPQIFQHIAKLSPFYWGLELFYGVFLENREWYDLLVNSFPLILSILVFQLLAFAGLKRQQLI